MTLRPPAGRGLRTAWASRLRVLLPWTVLLGAVAGAVVSVVGQRDQLHGALADIGTARVVVAIVLGTAGVAVTAEVWRRSVQAASRSLPRGLSYRVFWVSQAGKYVPGAVWPFVVQSLAARRLGVQPRGMLTGGVVFLMVHAVTGLLLASMALAVMPDAPTSLRLLTWGATATLLALFGTGAWRRVPRVMGRPTLPRLTPHAVARASGWMCVAWLLYGASTAVLLTPLIDGSGATGLVLGVTSSALGWLVGLLVVVAPAGAGARELAMAWVLGSTVAADDVLAVVLLTRLALLIGDLGLALASLRVVQQLRSSPEPVDPA